MPRPDLIWLALVVVTLLLVQPGPALAAPQVCPADMVAIPAGRFRIGAAGQLGEERAAAGVRLSPFCRDAHEVTNRQFAAFVVATGYRTVAERPLMVEQFPELSPAERKPDSLVFQPVAGDGPIEELSWWHWVSGADWRHPQGPGSSIAGFDDHPVVQIAFDDAQSYAAWAGAALPSEAQWEFAAPGGLKDQVFSWGNTWEPGLANTWQGEQFVHVIDVVPTILEAAGLRAPEVVDGIPQKPIEGTSFAYTFDSKNAKVPSRHKTQYFEMMGQWALYNEGWLLSTKVNRAPWEAFGPANPDPLNNQVLELYNLNNDFSQSTDLAAQNPQKVKEMKEAFIAEAKKYQVFPLDASVAARIVAPRPNITPAAPSSSTPVRWWGCSRGIRPCCSTPPTP